MLLEPDRVKLDADSIFSAAGLRKSVLNSANLALVMEALAWKGFLRVKHAFRRAFEHFLRLSASAAEVMLSLA